MNSDRRRKARARLGVNAFLLLVSIEWVFAQAPALSHNPLAEVDSLLIVRGYAEAQARLGEIAARIDIPGGVIEDYRSICRRLAPILIMRDSSVQAFATNGKGLRERFSVRDAGTTAAGCYAEFLAELEAGSYASASERFTLAEFLRQGHVRREKERLVADLELARALIKKKEFDQAGIVLDDFRQEPATVTYRIMRDTLERRHLSLEEEIAEAKSRRREESRRVKVAGRFSVDGGILLLRWQSVPYDFFHFKEPGANGVETFRYENREGAFTLTPVPLFVEIGYHVKPELHVGGFFGQATTHATGYLWRRETPSSFRADFRLDVFLLFIRYFLDARTGVRPYVGCTLGHVQWTLTPGSNPLSTLRVADAKEQSTVFGPTAGVHYIPFDAVPLTLAVSIDGIVSTRAATLVDGFTLALGLKVGVLL